MPETFEIAGKHLMETCLADLSVYKKAIKAMDSQAIRKLVESIIAQKLDQLEDLKTLTGSPADSQRITANTMTDGTNNGGADEAITGILPDPESLLKTVTARENAFAEATRALAAQAGSAEYRSALNACAERSRKFASWSQDHLDLLSLF